MRYLILIFFFTFTSYSFAACDLNQGQVVIQSRGSNENAIAFCNSKPQFLCYVSDSRNYEVYVSGNACCSSQNYYNQTSKTCESRCQDGSLPDSSGNCPVVCPDGQQPDLFGNCPSPLCPDGEYNNPDNGNCIPEPCEGGGFACCDSTTPPDACQNPPPCNEITDPECVPDPDPVCGSNQEWNGTICVDLNNSSSADSPSSDFNSSASDSAGDSSTGGEGGSGGSGSEGSTSSSGSGGTGSQGSTSSVASNYSGSGDCGTPPQCDDGEPLCEILKQDFELYCNSTDYEQTDFTSGDDHDQTFTDAYSDFKNRINNAPLINAVDNFFSCNQSGACPVANADLGFTTITFDAYCTWDYWPLIASVLFAVALFIGAFIALR